MTDRVEHTSGYIIQDAEGRYLSRSAFLKRQEAWYPHNRPGDAFVFPLGALEEILSISEGFASKPVRLISAYYVPEHKVTIPEEVVVSFNEVEVRGLSSADIIKRLNKDFEAAGDPTRLGGKK